jgi:hypothetical protein
VVSVTAILVLFLDWDDTLFTSASGEDGAADVVAKIDGAALEAIAFTT